MEQQAQFKNSLKQLRAVIKKQVPGVDRLPYSHNIISLTLQAISNTFGQEEANKAIRDFELRGLGWSEIKKKSRK